MVRLSGAVRRDEDGAVAVIVAVCATFLLLLAGLVADLGQARDVRQQAQNTADAAALAAATALYPAGPDAPDTAAAEAAARAFARDNYGVTDAQWATCTDADHLAVVGGTACISFDSAKPTTVRVVVPTRDIDTPFGRLAGIDDVSIAATAQATVQPSRRAKCGLCVIGHGDHVIQNGEITIEGASAYFNGSVEANPLGKITVTGADSVISVEGTASNKGTFTPGVLTGQPPLSDPLAFLSLPPSTIALEHKTSGDACTGGPGIYNSFSMTSCTLQPGLYVLAANAYTWHPSGQVNITAPGVTFYLTCRDAAGMPRTCDPGEQGGSILVTGNASLTVTAPTSGATRGLAIVADRNNTALFGFRGNGTSQSTGTIYAQSATLQYEGNGAGQVMDALIVVNGLTFAGANAKLNSSYSEENNTELPPGRPFLSR